MNSYRRRRSKVGTLTFGLALIGLLLFAGSLTSYATPPTPPVDGAPVIGGESGGLVSEADAQLAMPTDQIIVKYQDSRHAGGRLQPGGHGGDGSSERGCRRSTDV